MLHTPIYSAGTQLPVLVKKPDARHLFMYSAVTWNRHQIHYNGQWAQAEGLPGVVVQRALLGNYFAELVNTWAGDQGQLRYLDWKVIASAVPGDALHCNGTVAELNPQQGKLQAIVALSMHNQHQATVATGTAKVDFTPEDTA